jgi:hypothetical protein
MLEKLTGFYMTPKAMRQIYKYISVLTKKN